MMRPVILVVLLLDVSGSMALGSRIEALNSNVRTLLALMRSRSGEPAAPTQFWLAIAAFTDEPMWIVDEPAPPEEVLWAELSPRKKQRADIGRAVTEAEHLIAREVPGRFDDALLVVITDEAAAATMPPAESTIERVTLLVDSSAVDADTGSRPEDILQIARSLMG